MKNTNGRGKGAVDEIALVGGDAQRDGVNVELCSLKSGKLSPSQQGNNQVTIKKTRIRQTELQDAAKIPTVDLD
jgi:hypothetical protein